MVAVLDDRHRLGYERLERPGARAVALNEQTALEAGRMRDRLLDDGDRMATRDLLIAATARSTGDELIVADGDFKTGILSEMMDVPNLRRGN